jgi:YHS domain-containing protein
MIQSMLLAFAVFSADDPREPLRPWQPLVGGWKGLAVAIDKNGNRERDFTRLGVDWEWSIGKDRASLVWKVKEEKPYKRGVLTYDRSKEQFHFEVETADAKKWTFEGAAAGSKIEMNRIDGDLAGKERVRLAIVGKDRHMVVFETQYAKNRWRPTLEIGNTRRGVVFGETPKSGPECIVTGGRGSSTVSYKGKTYYVCCSGCKEAFNEDPEKYIAEAEAKKR